MSGNNFIGIPFKDGGRDRAGVDCWGLVMLYYHQQLGIELPEFRVSCFETEVIWGMVESARPAWVRLREPDMHCVVAVRLDQARHPGVVNHAGVYVGGGYFLHAISRMGSVLTRTDHPFYRGIIEGYYRWPT